MSVWDVVLCWRAAFSLCVVAPFGRFADVADGEDKIPLQNVDARILAKVIEYMKYHFKLTETPQPEDEVRRWDREFVRVDKSTLFHLVLVRYFAQFLSQCALLPELDTLLSRSNVGWCLVRCYFRERCSPVQLLSLPWRFSGHFVAGCLY